MKKKISIVLASYNGEEYIKEQIVSIQSNNGYNELVEEFIITDDGSTDRTISIIKEMQKNDKKIKLLNNYNGSGVINNFLNGLKVAIGDVIFLSDQDDIWMVDKLIVMYNAVVARSDEIPVLGISDSFLVNKDLIKMNETFFSNNKSSFPRDLRPKSIVVKNIAQGCVMAFNRKLLNMCNLEKNQKWIMHDWWLMLVASIEGVIFVDKTPLICYRVHGNNLVGIENGNLLWKLKNFRHLLDRYKHSIVQRLEQYICIESCLNKSVSISAWDFLRYESSTFRKLMALINYAYIRNEITYLLSKSSGSKHGK
ncbi:glycosyltransferase [Pluralibacter gergoviae]|uniref:glycosyltransferase n=1 Tax=Pluralibacter gergoviae TaxID=61647 RepID=UPI000907F391|nr:glycosyltransferase [Pluralibacter gergoviae]